MNAEQIRAALGDRYLGRGVWENKLNVGVDEEPSLPTAITRGLLESPCPWCPGALVKDTHLLALVPSMANGEPYSLMTLQKIMADLSSQHDAMVMEGYDSWRDAAWVSASSARAKWVLMPYTEALSESCASSSRFGDMAREFLNRDVHQQLEWYQARYEKEYRQATALEVATVAALYAIALGRIGTLVTGWLRASEASVAGGLVCVGRFYGESLEIIGDALPEASAYVGLALARRIDDSNEVVSP